MLAARLVREGMTYGLLHRTSHFCNSGDRMSLNPCDVLCHVCCCC